MLNMCTKFHETTFDSFNVKERTRFPYERGYSCQFKSTKGHNSMRNVVADMVFVLCTLFGDGFIL